MEKNNEMWEFYFYTYLTKGKWASAFLFTTKASAVTQGSIANVIVATCQR